MRRNIREDGFVTVWMAINLFVLLAFAGLAIDIANWHMEASKLQRDADSAALASVTRMPDNNAARLTALEALEKNGVVPGPDVSVDITFPGPDKVSVKVNDKKVETIFASFIMESISVTRQATGQYKQTVPMGNPFNAMGMDDLYPGQFEGGNQGYLLALNGYCTPTEYGDPYAARYTGNDGTYLGLPNACDGSRGSLNPLYRPYTGLDGGYDYIIDIKGTASQLIYLLDPGYNPGYYHGYNSYDIDLKAQSGDSTYLSTRYRLFSTDPASEGQFEDDVLIHSTTYGTYNAPAGVNGQVVLTTVPPGKYRLNVSTPETALSAGRSWGANTFGIRLATSSADTTICDTRVSATCSSAYAINALGVQTRGGASSVATFYLANIDSGYTGDNLDITTFDMGDDAQYVRLVRPDDGCMPFDWSTPAKETRPAMSGSVTSEICPSPHSAIDVSGSSPRLPGRYSSAKFNDRMVTMKTTMPLNYASVVAAAGGDTWWKVRYQGSPASGVGEDRTTWSATLSGGPVRLIE